MTLPRAVKRVVDEWLDAGRPPQPGIAWPRDRWIAMFPDQSALFEGLPDRLSRKHVAAACHSADQSPEQAVAGFLTAMAWGYGSVGFGPWRTARIFADNDDLPWRLLMASQTLAEEGAFGGYRALAGPHRICWLGPAFGTKFLAFCRQSAWRPQAIILDRLVAQWLLKNANVRLSPTTWSIRAYRHYVRRISEWAASLGLTAEELEMCIFRDEARLRGGQWGQRERRHRQGRNGMTARSEILQAAKSLASRGLTPFSPIQLITEVQRRGTSYPETTLRTHIVSAMCVNAPANHAVRYPDLIRIDRGQYELYKPGE